MWRKYMILVLVLFFVIVQVASSALASKTKLVWTAKGTPGPKSDAWIRWADEYEKINPSIDIEFMLTPEPYYDTLQVWMAGGTGADIMWMGTDFFTFVDQLFPLNKLYETDDNIKKILPNMIQAHSWKGKLLALPYGVNTHAVYYNKDAISAAGVTIPKGWTWDDAVRIGKHLTKDTNGDSKPDIWAYSFYFDTWWWHYSNKPVYTSDNSKVNIDNLVTIAAIQLWANLRNGQLGVQAVPQYGSDILNGRAVAGNRGVFDIPTYRNASFDWDVTELPWFEWQGDKYYSTFCSAEMWTIWNGTKHATEVLDFLKFIMSEEKNSEIGRIGGIIPVQPNAAAKSFLNADRPKSIRTFVDSLNYWNYGYYATPAYPVIKTIWVNQTWQDIMSLKTPAMVGVPELARQLNNSLAEYSTKQNK